MERIRKNPAFSREAELFGLPVHSPDIMSHEGRQLLGFGGISVPVIVLGEKSDVLASKSRPDQRSAHSLQTLPHGRATHTEHLTGFMDIAGVPVCPKNVLI